MRRFVEGVDRDQSTLFPECLHDWVCEDNPVRAVDVFVDGLDLAEHGFSGIEPEATGDAADAEAICEAVGRPRMRFVRGKSAEQQGRLMQHRTRDLLLRQQTQVINALRAHLAELGIAAAQGREGLKQLLATLRTKRMPGVRA